MMAGQIVDEPFAVMTVDPGGTTGVARGVYCWQGTVRETLLSSVAEAWEVEGESEMQAWEIASQWQEWKKELLTIGVPVARLHLVFESFELRTQRADLSSVEVIAGVRTLLVPRVSGLGLELTSATHGRIVFQSPADAKRFGTAARLKEWGMYSVGRGSDHKRDALRHLALKVARVGEGGA